MALAGGGSTDEIYEAVRERILSGALPPPAPVRQDALAQSLGVSKIPLREALVRLEQDGLLSLEKNRGFFVRSLDAAEAEEVFALRLKIEPECVALAALNATPEDQAAAHAALEALDQEVEAKGPRIGALHRAFHLALARPARRPVTAQMLERLHVLAERYVRKHLEPHGRRERAHAEHQILLDLWTRRDEPALVRATIAHIETTLADLRRQLASSTTGGGPDRLQTP
jgi:DNA-binding GntR family transcriptional regulator